MIIDDGIQRGIQKEKNATTGMHSKLHLKIPSFRPCIQFRMNSHYYNINRIYCVFIIEASSLNIILELNGSIPYN